MLTAIIETLFDCTDIWMTYLLIIQSNYNRVSDEPSCVLSILFNLPIVLDWSELLLLDLANHQWKYDLIVFKSERRDKLFCNGHNPSNIPIWN